MPRGVIVSVAIVLALVCSLLGAGLANVSANRGTPDSHGYFWTDTKTPAPSIAFNWIEINTTGTDTGVYGDDTYSYTPFDIGFSFYYYGNIYTQFYVSSNGFISFGSGSSSLSNDPIPDTSSPNNIICAYWDDLYVDSWDNGAIYYQTIGASPDTHLVVQYNNVTRLGDSRLMTFEIVLYENGDILVQYLTLNGMTGSGASVGIENSAGSVGSQYSYDSATLQDQLAILYSMGPVVLGPDQSASGEPSTTLSYILSVWNKQSVPDTFDITYTTVLGWAVDMLDSTYNPLDDTNSNGDPDTGLLASNSSITFFVNVTIPNTPSAQTETTVVNASSAVTLDAWDLCYLTSQTLDAWFDPPHNDFGSDTDDDSLWNYLVVEASLDVLVDGYYYIESTLYTGGGSAITSDWAYEYLTDGFQTMELDFFGWEIWETGSNGPYQVEMYLYDSSWTVIDTDTHWTDAYSATEFMVTPALLSPPHSDQGVDTDGDYTYDYLEFDASVAVAYSGTYIITAYLYTSGWDWIDYDTDTVALDAGDRTVPLTFDAWEIFKSGYDGPYIITIQLYIQIDTTNVYLSSGTHNTQAYSVYDFEGPGIFFWPNHDDFVVDTDGDGDYNWLVIEVQVNVTVAGTYNLVGDLLDWWGDVIETAENESMTLPVGIQIVNLYFAGWPIFYNDDSDDFEVEMTLYDADYAFQDEDYYETDFYWYDVFEGPPALFAPPHSSYGLDVNSDSAIDFIVVNASVDVDVAGTYSVTGEIYTDWWDVIDTVENETWLDEGPQVIELRFPGWVIRDSGDDGPYTVEMWLYDDGGRECDWGTHLTAAYTWDEFQTQPAAFAPPHDDYGDDTDGDTRFEWLVIEVHLAIYVGGDYTIRSYLYDSSWDLMTQSVDSYTLADGAQTVLVRFPGWLFVVNGQNGVFHVEMYLYDESDNYIEYNSHMTDSYLMSGFDSTMPEIMSSWSFDAPSVNGILTSGEWTDATVVDLVSADATNQVDATLLIMNDATNLYIALDAWGDEEEDSSDEASFAFDTENDELLTDGGEDQFLLSAWTPGSGTHYEYSDLSSWWVAHCSPFDELEPGHSSLAAAIGFGSSSGHASLHRVYEISIPLALMDAYAGDTVGFLAGGIGSAGVYDSYYGLESWWPRYFNWAPELDNYGDLSLANYVVPTPPTTSAALSGTAGTNGWYRSAVEVTLTATADNGLDYTNYSVDGGAWTTYTGPFDVTADGSHTVRFYSVDRASLKETAKSVAVNIDTVDPTTTASVSGAAFTLDSIDSTSGIGSTMFRIDNGTWRAYTGSYEVTGVGNHTVEFYSMDGAGNTENIGSTIVTVGEGGAGISSGTLLILVIGIVAAIAVLLVVFFLVKRKKGQPPVQQWQMAPPQMPPPPTQ